MGKKKPNKNKTARKVNYGSPTRSWVCVAKDDI